MASSSVAGAGSSSAAGPRLIAGLWVGEAKPAPEFAEDTPVNPITWSLALLSPSAVSAFGSGFFDDAGDIPGQPVLAFNLRGSWNADTNEVTLVKEYIGVPPGFAPTVKYTARLVRLEGEWSLQGSWMNESEGTHGQFVARREPNTM